MHAVARQVPIWLATLVIAGCPDDGKRPLGDRCSSSDECESGLCAANRCLDPDGDADFDGVINGVEAVLGSNPLDPDTDRDGAWDGVEIATDLTGVDTDGDGKLDVIESRVVDVDSDCIPDQYDAQDDVANTDLSPMRDVVCRLNGICGEQRDALGVACPGSVAICVYSGIEGFADPETACDGRDENCDGQADEGFPPGCDFDDYDLDGVVDTLDNCPETPNREQRDANRDGIGDACLDLYTIVFSPDPPSALEAGEVFSVSGAIVKTDLADPNSPMPRFRGPIDLLTIPDGGLGRQAVPALGNTFTFDGLAFARAGVWRLVLASSIGKAESGDIVVSAAAAAAIVLQAPSDAIAGEPFTISATIYDAFGNVADYNAPAELTTTDARAEIPPTGSFSAGHWSLSGVVLNSAGPTILMLFSGGLEGVAQVRVATGGVAALELAVPPSVRAGQAAGCTLTVYDAGGNVVTDFAGVVALVSTDTRSSPPPLVAFERADGGVRNFDVVFGDLGEQTLTASYGAVTVEASTLVRAGSPYRLLLAPTTPTTTATPLPVQVMVVDVFGHLADDPEDPYTGTVTFRVGGTQPDLLPTLPGPTTFTAGDRSQRIVETIWYRKGTWLLTATGTDLAVSTGSTEVYISPNPPAALEITLPERARAGVAVPMTVAIKDANGNLVPDFRGTIELDSSDDRSNLPERLLLAPDHGGSRTIDVVFATPGEHRVDGTFLALGGGADITVTAGPAHAVLLTTPSPAVVAEPQSLSVSIVDSVGNVAADPADPYLGTVTFQVDGAPNPPPDLPGSYTFSAADASQLASGVTWNAAGTFTLRVTASGLAQPNANAQVRVVLATKLEVSLPATVRAGVPADMVVRALGNSGALASAFVGQVTLRVDDGRSDLPSSITFTAADAGLKTLPVTFGTVGMRTVVATAADGLRGHDTTDVRAGIPDHIELTFDEGVAFVGEAKGLHVAITDRYGQLVEDPDAPYTGTVTFDVIGEQPEVPPTLPGPTVFSAADAGERDVETTWHRAGDYTLQATGTGLTDPTSNAPITVLGTPAGSIELSLPATATAGVVVQLTVTVRDDNGEIATGFADTILLSDDDIAGGPPPSITLGPADAGVKTIDVIFGRSGLRTVNASWQDVGASATITVLAGAPHHLVMTGPTEGLTGESLPFTVAIFDAYSNVANNPALPFVGNVELRASGPSIDPPSFLPFLPPSVPTPLSFTAGDGGVQTVRTVYFRPGGWSLRASTTGLADPTASRSFTIEVGPPTQLDIELFGTFIAGDELSVLVRATDAWRNTAPSYSGIVDLIGLRHTIELPEIFLLDPVLLTNGEAEQFPLTLTVAGDYTIIAADKTGLYGERDFVIRPADPYRLVVTGPQAVLVDELLTLFVSVEDVYQNIVDDFVGDIDVEVDGATDFSPSNPDFSFTLADEGVHEFGVTFASPGFREIDFNGTAAGIAPEGFTTYEIVVASGAPPVSLGFNRGHGPHYVDEVFTAAVGLFDANNTPTISAKPIDIELELREQYPSAATLSGTAEGTIPVGDHQIVFDDLSINYDGNFTLRASAPENDIDLAELIFDVFYRAPTISNLQATKVGGCVELGYAVAQSGGSVGAPVTIRVEQRVTGEFDWAPATQAASDDRFAGHYELPSGESYLFNWNAAKDLENNNTVTPVEIRVHARSGQRIVDNPETTETLSANIGAFTAEEFCQREVSAVLAAPNWPDPIVQSEDPLMPLTSPVAATDFDRDGKLDLLRNRRSGSAGLAYGRGDGGFEPTEMTVTTPAAIVDLPFNVATGWLDGDDLPDLLISTLGEIVVYLQDSPGSFVAGRTITTNLFSPVVVRDMDGDRLDDIVFTRQPDAAPADTDVMIAYQDSDPTASFQTEVEVWSGSDVNITQLSVGNIDGLDDLDVVFYVYTDSTAYHELIQVRSDGDRSYDGSESLYVETINFEGPRATRPAVRDLQIHDKLTANPLVLYRVLPYGAFTWDGRRVETDRFGDGWGFEQEVEMCTHDGGVTYGYFDDLVYTRFDPTPDIAAQCTADGYYTLGFNLFSESVGSVTSEYWPVHFDQNATLIAMDFTGDGVDDIATDQGVVEITPPGRSTTEDPEPRVPRTSFTSADSYSMDWTRIAVDLDLDGTSEVVDPELDTVIEIDTQITYTILRLTFACPYDFFSCFAWSQPSVALCGSDCPAFADWHVELASAQIDGIGPEEIVAMTSVDGGPTDIFVFQFDSGDWSILASTSGLTESVHPISTLPPLFEGTALAVGDALGDGDGRDDIAVAGHYVNAAGDAFLIHWDATCNDNAGCFETYWSDSGGDLEPSPRALFIGEFFDSTATPRQMVVVGAETTDYVTVAPNLCNDDGAQCTRFRVDVDRHPIYLSSNDFSVDGVGVIDDDGDGELVLLASIREAVGSGTDHLLVRMQPPSGSSVTQFVRSYPQPPCDGFATFDCVEPALGPLVADIDNDGNDDVLLGWGRGQVWEAWTQVAHPFGFDTNYLFGATTSERGFNPLAADIDGNGLLDVLLFDLLEDGQFWMLGQELGPIPSFEEF